jgi:hypothetical protein
LVSQLASLRSSHSATVYLEQENNQGTSDKPHVPQADPPVIGLHNSTKGETGKKVTDHMRDKYAKIDIKLNHNSMNIIAYLVRHNEHLVPLKPASRARW